MAKNEWVLKISKLGHDVINKKSNASHAKGLPTNSINQHIRYMLAWPYLLGAKRQIERYQKVASTLKTSRVDGIFQCIYESSTLFEGLNTIASYAKKCGHTHTDHELWLNIRNHIRHDVREEFDNDGKKRKKERAEMLKLNPKLQMDMGFTADSIRVGSETIEIKRVNNYLIWAESVMLNVFEDAKEKGYVK